MADYLNRLIQRTSGQMPVIKPVGRSSYGTLPLINESVTKFEETVIFNEGANSPVSRRKTPTSQTKSQEITGQSNINETQELVKTSLESEVKAAPDTSQRLIRGSKSSTRSPRGNERVISSGRETTQDKTKKTIAENGNQNRKVVTNTLETRKMQEAVNWQRRTVDRIQTTSPDNSLITGETPEHRDVESLLNPKRNISQPRVMKVQEEMPVIPLDSNLPVKNFSRELETEEREEMIQQVNLVQRYKPEVNLRPSERMIPDRAEVRSALEQESGSSMNIRVTIGRVEIKAVQQPERQTQHTTSIPKRPAVSLDAYLKGRDEGGR